MKNKTIFAIAAAVAAIPGVSFAQETPSTTSTGQSQETQSPAPSTQDSQPTAPGSQTMAQPAQPVAPKPGDAIYDNAGATIGSVDSVSGQAVVLSTTKGKATIPVTSLAMGANGLMINMTKAQVETAIAAAHSKRASK